METDGGSGLNVRKCTRSYIAETGEVVPAFNYEQGRPEGTPPRQITPAEFARIMAPTAEETPVPDSEEN